MKCWRKKGCTFNSNNSFKYMKCLQENYSVSKCKKDNKEKTYLLLGNTNIIFAIIQKGSAQEGKYTQEVKGGK